MKINKNFMKFGLVAGLVVVFCCFGKSVVSNRAEYTSVAAEASSQNQTSKAHGAASKKSPRAKTATSAMSSKKNYSKSPEQARVASSISNEKHYYILDAPNDPQYSNQWIFSNVNTIAAWGITEDSSSVTVAVLDTGFGLNHQDLSSRWYTNTGEAGDGKDTNGIDDDGNGYVDDWRGWDFNSVDNAPQAGAVNPNGEGVAHGTEVAGLVGASSDNSVGVASIARNPQIMPLQVMSDEGEGDSSSITSAIYYATNKGADVINMSLGTSGDDPAVRDAVDYAVAHNVVVIAAAGNCGSSASGVCANQPAGVITFPASYNRVVAVGASTQSNTRASFSSYGQRLDLVAPGANVGPTTSWSAGNDTSLYASGINGTSFASPITASAAALIRSIRPDSSVDDVRALLMSSAQKVSAMAGNVYSENYGHGLLDVGRAIEIASDLNASGESMPNLYIAGNYKANSQFRPGDSLGSGCQVTSDTWCTVWFRNTTQNYDRFLPYGKTDESGDYGWVWLGSILQSGEWQVQARQGDVLSSDIKTIFSK